MPKLQNRRRFLRAAALGQGVWSLTTRLHAAPTETSSEEQALRNAAALGDRFLVWQSPYGGPDPVKCPYRTPGLFNAYHLHPCGPAARALYRLARHTGVNDYKRAADGYAVFLINAIHDPVTPYVNKIELNGTERNLLSSAWMFGKALSPCYEWFCLENPREDAWELKSYAIYRWLQRHRRADSYFGVGYPTGRAPDAQFSCDLGEVGTGLMGFYAISKHQPALDDAIGLARFFLTEYEPGSGRGVWSSRLGVWLVGPQAGTGAEHFKGQNYTEVGWGWSAYIAAEYLLRLREHLNDVAMRKSIEEKCLSALRWCFDACQFEDGAHGMFGRDDKWVGMGAAAILLYVELHKAGLITPQWTETYGPRLKKSWQWLLANTGRDTFPPDGYIAVSGSTSKRPLENMFWLMSWTVEALLEGRKMLAA